MRELRGLAADGDEHFDPCVGPPIPTSPLGGSLLSRPTMLDVALYVGAVLLVLVAFGLPLALALSPRPWRRWWPVAAPLYGLAGLALVQLPLGTLFSPGDAAVPALIVALVAFAVAWWRYGRPPRPTRSSLLIIAAVAPAGVLAYRPTVRLSEPRPSGVLNEDSIYYLGIDAWLREHGVRDEPPSPDVDGFFATARAAWETHLRIGVDLVNVETSTLIGVDPLETLPALSAILVALVGLGTALALIALRAPSWAALLGAVLVSTRPETLRLSLDSYIAQAAGVALAPIAGVALVLALVSGGRQWLASAGLFAGALAAYYVEYAPWLALTGVVACLALILAPALLDRTSVDVDSERSRSTVVARGLSVLALTVLLNPLAIYNGVQSLEAGASLSGESILPFYGLLRSLGLVTGPYSVLYAASDASLFLGTAAAVVLAVTCPHLPRRLLVVLGAMLLAAAAFAVHQAYVQDYSYGLYKVLGLAAPVVVIALVLVVATSGTPVGIRSVAGLVVAGLLILNLPAALDVSRLSLGGVNGMVPEDDDLRRVPALLPGVKSVALEGTDAAGTPNARQHYGVYFLRSFNRQQVTYARGPGSYYTTGLESGRADVDRSFSPDYGGVVSWGPSLTHSDPVAQLGGWHVYRRTPGPDLLLIGRDGWIFPTEGPEGRLMRWTRGPALAWLSTKRATRVRIRVRVAAPFRQDRFRIRVGNRDVLSRVVPTAPTDVLTKPFLVPRGRTVISFLSVPRAAPTGGDLLGVGLLEATVEEVET